MLSMLEFAPMLRDCTSCCSGNSGSYGCGARQQGLGRYRVCSKRFLVEKLFEVPAGLPPTPKVDRPLSARRPLCARLAQTGVLVPRAKAFSQRRKTLRNALADYASAEG